ncbi:MAG: hypothetical protein R3F41_14320 [Gammaproteobacteria bacterium]|nr:hypothetical protein [Pseudomonadales bacterium]MCP5347153.1 hypothetical protein [Pseudomonadales bacterium]
MNLDNLNKWLTLIANLGVIAGLFVLISEIRYAVETTQFQTYQSRIDSQIERNAEFALSRELADIYQKVDTQGLDSLVGSEYRRYLSWEASKLQRFQGTYAAWKRGFLSDDENTESLNAAAREYQRRWAPMELNIVNTEFLEAILKVSDPPPPVLIDR